MINSTVLLCRSVLYRLSSDQYAVVRYWIRNGINLDRLKHVENIRSAAAVHKLYTIFQPAFRLNIIYTLRILNIPL